MVSLLECPSLKLHFNLNTRRSLQSRTRRHRATVVSASSNNNKDSVTSSSSSSSKPTKLITFLGKGGSGKTTAAVFAAQHFAMAGLSTCLVIHSQDPTADYLLGQKIGTSPVLCNNNLSAVRLETTKMLLAPLNQLKQADAQLNMTQGVLERVVGEELGVLPGMDSIFSMLELERLVGLFGNVAPTRIGKDKFDVIIYDSNNTEETLRMIGTSSKARLYLRYVRSLAEKTDIGRLAAPSLLRLVEEAISISSKRSPLDGKKSAEIWDDIEGVLEKGASRVSDPSKLSCFIVMDPNNPTSVNSALRYWGCTIQAGVQVSGAVAFASPDLNKEAEKKFKEKFSPLSFASIPYISTESPLDWNSIIQNQTSENARNLLSPIAGRNSKLVPTVNFDVTKKSVTLLMPGFDKSEIKLYQYRGGSELLVEAGDQRRVIRLPPQIQGKVGGAKFTDRNLVITMV